MTTQAAVARPGPWQTSSYDALKLGVWRHTVLDATGQMVAAIYGEDDEPTARLIAAAPELLITLKNLCDELEAEFPSDDETTTPARALIAKVEGR